MALGMLDTDGVRLGVENEGVLVTSLDLPFRICACQYLMLSKSHEVDKYLLRGQCNCTSELQQT